MKVINFKINDRYEHVIDFDSSSNFVEKFIITSSDGERIPIISMSKKKDDGITLETTSSSDTIYIRSVCLNGVEDTTPVDGIEIEKYEIDYTLSSKKVDGAKGSQEPSFNGQHGSSTKPNIQSNSGNVNILDEDGYYLQFTEVLSDNKIYQITVNFNFDQEGKQFGSQSIILYLAKKCNVADVLLDFGSEATQMIVCKRDTNIDISNIVNLFTDIKNKYAKDGDRGANGEDFYQYDLKSPRLYSSYFLLKKRMTNEDINKLQNDIFISPESDILRVLTTKKEVQNIKNDYLISPNIKLSGFGGIEPPAIMVGEQETYVNDIGGNKSYTIYRHSISLFIQEALNNLANRKVPLASFHFLMPNVYEQCDIIKLLRSLQEDITKLVIKPEYSVIKGFEVTAVSESDASLMGVFAFYASSYHRAELESGNYLLLDAGKGTLDFSLVNCEFSNCSNAWTFNNIWRSGIIGAGNSLSYSFLLALVHQYLDICYEPTNGSGIEENTVANFVQNNIIGVTSNAVSGAGDPALVLNMMRLVDKYKQNEWNQVLSEENTDNDKFKNINEIKLEGFVKWLEEHMDGDKIIKLTHYHDYVTKMINAIVAETICNIKYMQDGRENVTINHVIFAGRAFNFKKFKSEMLSALRKMEYCSTANQIELNSLGNNVSMKTICLMCINSLNDGNYHRKILSRPELLISKESPNNLNGRDKSYCENVKKNNFLQWLKNSLNIFYRNNEEINGENKLKKIIIKKVGDGFEISERSSASNEYWDIKNLRCTRISIGGFIYDWTIHDNKDNNIKIKVIFDGENYKIQSLKGQAEFQTSIRLKTSNFLYSSFFPNVIITEGEQNILIPNTVSNVEDVLPEADMSLSNSGESPINSSEQSVIDLDKLVNP